MAYQKGSDMLLKVDSDGAGTYQTIAAIQASDLTINEQSVDVTNQGSTNKWRELLAGAGIKSMRVSGRGVFNDAAGENTALTYKLNGTQRNWQVVVPALGTFTALMHIASLKYAGPHDKEVQFDIDLESAGAVSFA